MAVLSGFAILTTDRLDRLVDFYRSAFGAEQTYSFPGADGTDAYVALTIGGVHLGIGRADVTARGTERMALWFSVDDVDESFRQAIAAGATVESEPTQMPWGERVAQVRDPDGFLVNLGAEAR